MKQIIHFGHKRTYTGSQTLYGALNGTLYDGSENAAAWLADGTFRNLRIVGRTDGATAITVGITLMVNGSPTSLTASANANGGTDVDTSNSVAVTAGDTVGIRLVASGSSGGVQCETLIHLEFDSDNDNETCYQMNLAMVIAPLTAAFVWSPFPFLANTAIGPQQDGASQQEAHDTLMGVAGNITAIAWRVLDDDGSTTATTGTDLVCTVYKNGVATAATFTIGSGASSGSWTGTLAVAETDVLRLHIDPAGSAYPEDVIVNFGTLFEPTTDGDFVLVVQTTGTLPTTSAGYISAFNLAALWDNTETDIEGIGGPTTWYANALVVDYTPHATLTDPYRVDLRLNETSPGGPSQGFTTPAQGAGSNFPAFRVALRGSTTQSPGGMAISDGDTWAIRYMEAQPIVGSFAVGVDTTVTATRAIAFGLDGNTNVHNTAGMFKVFGDMEVTGTFTSGGGGGGDISADLDGLGT